MWRRRKQALLTPGGAQTRTDPQEGIEDLVGEVGVQGGTGVEDLSGAPVDIEPAGGVRDVEYSLL